MRGYTTVEEVQADFKSITFDKTTLVSIDDVEQFIVEADALINSFVGKKYQTPVTADSSSTTLLKLFSRTIVRDRIKELLQVKQTGGNTSANQDVRGAYGTRDVMAQLRAIQKSELELSGATPLVTHGAFSSFNVAHGVKPIFKKNQRQW